MVQGGRGKASRRRFCCADEEVGTARSPQLRAVVAPHPTEDPAFDDARRPPARLKMGTVKFGQVQSTLETSQCMAPADECNRHCDVSILLIC